MVTMRLASAGSWADIQAPAALERASRRSLAGPAATRVDMTGQDQSGALLCGLHLARPWLGGEATIKFVGEAESSASFQSRARVSSCETR